MEETAQLIATAIILVISYFGSRHSKEARRQATDANDAVNHRHEDQPRLFDLVDQMSGRVDELIDWKNGYEGSPWTDARAIEEWINTNTGTKHDEDDSDDPERDAPIKL